MLKQKFEEAASRIKELLPTAQAREAVQKILKECDILTQTELQKQFDQIEVMRERIVLLEARIEALEAKNKK